MNAICDLRRFLLPGVLGLLLAGPWCLPARGQPVKPLPRQSAAESEAPPPSAPAPSGGSPWGLILGLFAGGVVVAVVVYALTQKKGKGGGPDAVVDAGGIIEGYRLQTHLMTGQASQVWEAVEVASGRHFAIKMLLPEKAREGDHRRLLFHEAEVGQQLAHPNIIRIVKVIKSASNPGFVMEFFPSGSLKLKVMHKQADFIKEHAQSIFKQAATALAFMNAKGYVHRDVKPDNILVNAAGEAKLIDFALARRMPKGMAKTFRRRGKAQGTRSYMSPEQIRGEALDGRADVYSFGATAYEIVTGRPPFRGASAQDLLKKHIVEKPVSPKVHNPDVTDEFAELVLRMLAKKRDQRPKDFHEVLMKLRTIKVFKSQAAQPSATE